MAKRIERLTSQGSYVACMIRDVARRRAVAYKMPAPGASHQCLALNGRHGDCDVLCNHGARERPAPAERAAESRIAPRRTTVGMRFAGPGLRGAPDSCDPESLPARHPQQLSPPPCRAPRRP